MRSPAYNTNTIQQLSSIPAFGLETDKCNADRQHGKLHNRSVKNVGFGIHSSDNVTKNRALRMKANARKIVGYIPILGLYIGLKRIITTSIVPKEDLPNKANHIVRGSLEMIGLGWLLALPDYILQNRRDKKTDELLILLADRNNGQWNNNLNQNPHIHIPAPTINLMVPGVNNLT